MPGIPFSEVKARLLADPDTARAYDEAVEEYAALEAMIRARAGSGLTQAELAERMGTTQSAIARLESGRVSPTVETLQKYARALGKRLKIEMV
ncbi:MAG: hypothetical protein Q27BPR15_05380 [Rhodobacter sp. CACIA14H1]|nr:MAG: hypothetical protein Q27BPR15_05380 [Rhodobacter sp. CACIA14H1]